MHSLSLNNLERSFHMEIRSAQSDIAFAQRKLHARGPGSPVHYRNRIEWAQNDIADARRRIIALRKLLGR